MAVFHLQIVSMDRLVYDGEVQSISCRTIHGDMAVLANHCNYCTALGTGKARLVEADGTERFAACSGGMLSVIDEKCRLISTTWVWEDEIDIKRAEISKQKANELRHRTDIAQKDL